MTLFNHFMIIFITLIINNIAIAEAETSEAEISEAEKELYLQEMPNDFILGDKDASITFIEYSSLSCPHCAEFNKKILPDIITQYVDTGKVKYIHRDFPTDLPSLHGTMLLHCVGQEKYFLYLKVLFDKQYSWVMSAKYLEILENIAKLGGMSGEEFHQCIEDTKLKESLMNKVLKAQKTLAINGTPVFIINGKIITGLPANNQIFSQEFEKILINKID